MQVRFSSRAFRRVGVLVALVVFAVAALSATSAFAAYTTYISSDYSPTTAINILWSPTGKPAGAKFQYAYKDGQSGAWKTMSPTTSNQLSFKGVYGHTYWFRSRYVTDSTNYPWSQTISYAVPYDNGVMSFTRGSYAWGYGTVRGWAYNNGVRYSTRAGAYASYTFTGKRVSVIATKGRGRGKVAIYLDGKLNRIVDTYYYQTRYRKRIFDYTWSTSGTHRIIIKNLGTRGRPRVELDGIAVVRPDTLAPTGIALGAPDYSNDQTPTVSLSGDDNVGISYVKMATNSAMTGAVTQSFWGSPTDVDWDLGSAEGTKTVYARFYDEAGNASGSTSARVVLDTTAPTLGVTSTDTTIPIGVPQTITASVVDSSPIDIQLMYRTLGGPSGFTTATMTPTDATHYTAEIPGAPVSDVEWVVSVTDRAGNVSQTTPRRIRSVDINPGGLIPTPGDRRVDLAWIGAVGVTFDGYKVFRSENLGAFTQIGTVGPETTTFADTGVLNGRTYSYYVIAYGPGTNESLPSNEAAAVLPQKLAGLSVTVPTSVVVGQPFSAGVTAVDDNGATYLPSFTATMTPSAGGSLDTTALALSGGTGNGSFSYLKLGTTTIAATAVDPVYGNQVSGTSGALDVQPVPAPTGLATTPGDRQAALAWSASPNSGITAYKVYRAASLGGPYTQIATATAGASPAYTDTSVLNGSTYYYKVSTWGPGANEGVLTSGTSAALPQKLSSLAVSVPSTATVGQNFSVTVTATNDNGGSYTPTITVDIGENGTGTISPSTLQLVNGTGTAANFAYTLTGDIRVSATGTDPVSGRPVTAQSATMTVQPVPAPTGLTFTPLDSAVKLDWSPVNGYGVTSYRVYSATAVGGPYSQIATVAAGTTTYTDSLPENNSTTYYRVTAYGPGTNESLPSNAVTAVLPQKLASLAVSVPSTATVGQNFSVTVTAKDDKNASYTPTLTVSIGENGAGAIAPTTLQLVNGTGTGTTFTYDTTGDIRVSATGTDPVSGQPVAAQSATMTVQPVPAPTGLATTPGDRQVSLTWNASPYTGVSAYKVYRAPSVGGPYTQIATATVGASPSYTDNGVLNGSTYYYQVSTWGPGANEGLKTAAVSAALPQKLGTLLVSVPASATVGQTFTVTVTARDDNNTTYTAPFAATMAATGGTGSLSPTTLAVSSGTGTGSFSYTAVGSIRVTAQSGSVVGTSAVVSIDPVPAPTGLVAAPGDHKATLTWNAVSSAYGFTAYKVFRASAPGGPYTEVASVATSTPTYADTSVANGATYYYQVATFDPYGADGTRSSTASAVLPQKLASLTISVPETATAGQSFTATVTARDESGALFTPSVVLTASADGTGTLTPTEGIAITGGSAQVQFTYGPDPATILINIYGIDPTYGGLQIVGTSTPIGILAP